MLLVEVAETDGVICLKQGIDGGDEVGDGLAQLGIAHGGWLGEVAQEGFVDLLAEAVRQVGVFVVKGVCAVQYVPVGGQYAVDLGGGVDDGADGVEDVFYSAKDAVYVV